MRSINRQIFSRLLWMLFIILTEIAAIGYLVFVYHLSRREWFLPFFVLIGILLYAYGNLMRARYLRKNMERLAKGEVTRLVPVHNEIDTSLAIPAGTQLKLRRAIPLKFYLILMLIAIPFAYGYSYEWLHSLNIVPINTIFTIILFFLTIPFTLQRMLGVSLIPQLVSIDDSSITVQHGRQTQSLRWNEIRGIWREGGGGLDSIHSTFYLFDDNHYIELYLIADATMIPLLWETSDKRDAYLKGARQIIATLTSRTGLPTFIDTQGLDSLDNLTIADVQQLQLATIDPVIAPSTLPVRLSFRQKAARRLQDAFQWTLVSAVILGVLFACNLIGDIPSEGPFMLFMLGAGTLMLIILFLFFLLSSGSEKKAIVVDEQGIRQGKTFLKWEEIRAWGRYAMNPNSTTIQQYVVFTDHAILRWIERDSDELGERGTTGDLHTAFRERALQLHSVITTKTGLPLREIPYELVAN
jgi:hypothetical protein